MKTLKLLLQIAVISIISQSCTSSSSAESENEDAIEEAATEAAEVESDSTSLIMEEEIYCCGNHDPAHCGTIEEIENYTDCDGFS